MPITKIGVGLTRVKTQFNAPDHCPQCKDKRTMVIPPDPIFGGVLTHLCTKCNYNWHPNMDEPPQLDKGDLLPPAKPPSPPEPKSMDTWILGKAGACPSCASIDIEMEIVERSVPVSSTYYWGCKTCGATWKVKYVLEEVEILNDGD